MGKRYRIEKPQEEVKTEEKAELTEEEALQTAIKAVEDKEELKVIYAVVDAAAVNVRQKPSIESASVDILKKGEKVQLGKIEGEFTHIFYGYDFLKAGYMMTKYLKEID